VIAAFSALGIENQESGYDLAATILEIIPILVLSFMVLKIIGVWNNETPSKINYYLLVYTIASVAIYFGLRYLFVNDLTSETPTPFLGTVIYYFIWTSYFKRSTRVKEFYGCNAVKK